LKLIKLKKKKEHAERVAEYKAQDNGMRLPVRMTNRQAHSYKPWPKSYNHDPAGGPTGGYKDKMQDWRFQQNQALEYKKAKHKQTQ
jgi:hypothetical protein